MRRAIQTFAAACAAVALAACAPDVPQVAPAPSPDEAAAVVEQQWDRIFSATFDEISAADADKDPKLLADRVQGDAKLVRAAQYKQAAAKNGPAPQQLPSETQAVYVSGADTWPRVLVAVSAQPKDELTPVVMLWVQDDVRSDYTLRAWAHMIPGATLPAMPGPVDGATQLALDANSVTPSPDQAVADYAALLKAGAASELNDAFAPDSYRTRLFTARTVLTKAAKKAKGGYADKIETRIDDTYVLETADGGALVFAPLEIASIFSVKNAKVSVPASDQALVDGKLTSRVVHRYRDMIVMHIPSGDVDALPVVVAADHHLVRVSAK